MLPQKPAVDGVTPIGALTEWTIWCYLRWLLIHSTLAFQDFQISFEVCVLDEIDGRCRRWVSFYLSSLSLVLASVACPIDCNTHKHTNNVSFLVVSSSSSTQTLAHKHNLNFFILFKHNHFMPKFKIFSNFIDLFLKLYIGLRKPAISIVISLVELDSSKHWEELKFVCFFPFRLFMLVLPHDVFIRWFLHSFVFAIVVVRLCIFSFSSQRRTSPQKKTFCLCVFKAVQWNEISPELYWRDWRRRLDGGVGWLVESNWAFAFTQNTMMLFAQLLHGSP